MGSASMELLRSTKGPSAARWAPPTPPPPPTLEVPSLASREGRDINESWVPSRQTLRQFASAEDAVLDGGMFSALEVPIEDGGSGGKMGWWWWWLVGCSLSWKYLWGMWE